jgi:hypothetical protein
MTTTPPGWLKTSRFVWHELERVAFEPLRKIVFQGYTPGLMDSLEAWYSLEHCQPFQLAHVGSGAKFVWEKRVFNLWRDPYAIPRLGRTGFWIAAGDRRLGIAIADPDEALEAAQSLAHLFQGQIYSEQIDA